MQVGNLHHAWRSRAWLILSLGLTIALANVTLAQKAKEKNYFDRVARALRDKEPNRFDELTVATNLADDKDAVRLVPSLEHAIRKDTESNVRVAAIKCLALIEKNRKAPCPNIIVETLLDQDEEIYDAASMATEIFDRFSEASIASLIKCSESKNPELRSDGITYLGRTGSRSKQVLEVIRNGTRDKNIMVAHNSQVALFEATDDMQGFLVYLIPLRNAAISKEDASASPNNAKSQVQTIHSLYGLAAHTLTDRWAVERTTQLADSVIALLQDKSADIRRGACLIIEEYAGKSTDPSDELAEWKELANSGVSGKTRNRTSDDFVKTLASHNAVKRLQSLIDSDPEKSIQDAARSALRKLSKAEVDLPASTPKK